MVSAGRGSKQRCVRPLGADVEAALEAGEVRRGPAGHTACATPASVLCRACWSLAGQLGRRHGCRLWLQPAGSRMRCNTAPLPALPAQAVAGAALAAVVAAVVSTGSRRARPSVSLGWRQRQGRRGGAVEQGCCSCWLIVACCSCCIALSFLMCRGGGGGRIRAPLRGRDGLQAHKHDGAPLHAPCSLAAQDGAGSGSCTAGMFISPAAEQRAPRHT